MGPNFLMTLPSLILGSRVITKFYFIGRHSVMLVMKCRVLLSFL